ncbi:MAG TPA: HAD family hydrolase [Terriglobia bacterium]|nr:HAD family hydrolase [Terriglobia bacterium]
MQFTREVKAVLFDLDDTLFDHRYAARCVLQDLQARHPGLREHSLEFLEREDFRLLGEKHALVMAGSLSPDDARMQRIRSLFACCGEEITIQCAKELAAHRVEIYRQSRRPVAGAVALLQELKRRTQIGIVTNNFTQEQHEKVKACGLTPLIDVLVTSEEIGRLKPEREIFQAALRRLECGPDEAVMVGDSWEVDVVGAANAGIRAVWFNRNGLRKPDLPGAVEITSLEPAEAVAELIISPEGSAQAPRSRP